MIATLMEILQTTLLARHAQHVVLVHFPIALFITALVFDIAAQCNRKRRHGLANAAYYNLLVAAISTIPVFVSGILAWQLQLDGEKLRGSLLEHLALGTVASAMIWLTWWLRFRARRRNEALPKYYFAIQLAAVMFVMLTGHLGGIVSGVNLPG